MPTVMEPVSWASSAGQRQPSSLSFGGAAAQHESSLTPAVVLAAGLPAHAGALRLAAGMHEWETA